MPWFDTLYNLLYPQNPIWPFGDRSLIEITNRCGIKSAVRINDSSVKVHHCSFISCKQNEFGAALFIHISRVELEDCQFYECSASQSAACFFYMCKSISVNNCLYAHGVANYIPAILYSFGEPSLNSSLTNTNFTNNIAKKFVSAIRLSTCSGQIQNCYFHKNKGKRAGCIYDFIMIPNEREVIECNFLNNTSNSEGSCLSLYHHSYKGKIKSSYFIGNYCKNNSNSIVLKSDYGEISIIDCFFTESEDNEIENIYYENAKISIIQPQFNQTSISVNISSIYSEISAAVKNINP